MTSERTGMRKTVMSETARITSTRCGCFKGVQSGSTAARKADGPAFELVQTVRHAQVTSSGTLESFSTRGSVGSLMIKHVAQQAVGRRWSTAPGRRRSRQGSSSAHPPAAMTARGGRPSSEAPVQCLAWLLRVVT